MKLRVQYMAQLRSVIGCAEEEVELPDGSNLAALQLTSALILTDGFESGTTVHWSMVLP